MKKYLLLCLLISPLLQANKTIYGPFGYDYEQSNPKDFILTINRSKISRPRDTTVFWKKKKYSYIAVPVTLLNNSNETLSYWKMSCSTSDIFTTSNKNVEIELEPCEHNVAKNYSILPHLSATYTLLLFFSKDSAKSEIRSAVGMYLCKTSEVSSDAFLQYIIHGKFSKQLLIWSNDIQIYSH